jgi:hypothetical protein
MLTAQENQYSAAKISEFLFWKTAPRYTSMVGNFYSIEACVAVSETLTNEGA